MLLPLPTMKRATLYSQGVEPANPSSDLLPAPHGKKKKNSKTKASQLPVTLNKLNKSRKEPLKSNTESWRVNKEEIDSVLNRLR